MDSSVMCLDDSLDRRKTEPRSTRLRGEEWGEELLADVGRDAGTDIGDSNLTRVVGRHHRHADDTFSAHRVRAVEEKIEKYDLDEPGVCQDRRRGAGHIHMNIRMCWILTQ